MKKIFKALAITATAAAMCVGIGLTAGCSNTEKTYIGEYHYLGYYGQEYGMVVEVSVKDNIITKIKDVTNDANNEQAKALQTYKDVVDGKEAAEATYHTWHTVSAGWSTYYKNSPWLWTEEDGSGNKIPSNPVPQPADIGQFYGWSDEDEATWTDHVSWLAGQYVGKSVADILDIKVYVNYGYSHVTGGSNYNTAVDKDSMGEPYGVSYNSELNESGLIISGSTQGSGRLLLAVQNALGK